MYNFDENKNVLALFHFQKLLTVGINVDKLCLVMHEFQWANCCRSVHPLTKPNCPPSGLQMLWLLLFLHSTLF